MSLFRQMVDVNLMGAVLVSRCFCDQLRTLYQS